MTPGDAGLYGPSIFRIGYTATYEGALRVEEFMGEWIKFNQWTHCSFQWGAFGTRLYIDGEIASGSVYQWDQGLRDEPYIVIGTWWDPDWGFNGYIDDIRFWPCAGHGTLTATPTQSQTRTPTVTLTGTITPTSSITETHTVTETWTPVMTDTVTKTPTVSPTFTVTPLPTASRTETLTATVTDTITATPTPALMELIGAFPNPARLSVKIVFTSPEACPAEFTLYTVTGEKAGAMAFNAAAGMNAIVFRLKNPAGISLSSGVYLYRLDFISGKGGAQALCGKISVTK
jgi:hypothetical protein